MRTTVVPAQVTTVEDKIAGNLSFTQLILLTAPIFISGVCFALIPPFMGVTLFKVGLSGSLFLVCCLLAIRIRGLIIAQWLGVIVRYNLRARYFLYDKNDQYLRTKLVKDPEEVVANEIQTEYQLETKPAVAIPTLKLVQAEAAVADPRATFRITTKKGGLRVSIKEIK